MPNPSYRRFHCFYEGCDAPAPFGLRLAGMRSELKKEMQDKYLWYCRDHEEEALMRRVKVTGEVGTTGMGKGRPFLGPPMSRK